MHSKIHPVHIADVTQDEADTLSHKTKLKYAEAIRQY